jgi:hypothetical protein
VNAGLSKVKGKFLSFFISLFLTVVLLFPVEIAVSIMTSYYISIMISGNYSLGHFFLLFFGFLFLFLALLPALIGSYVVEPTHQPFGVLGASFGSILHIYLLLFPLSNAHIQPLVAGAEATIGDIFVFNFMFSLFGGLFGLAARGLKEERSKKRVAERGAISSPF